MVEFLPEDAEINKSKMEIMAIEQLFFAINSSTFSPKFMDALRNGLEFLGRYHQELLNKLGPDEVAKMKAANNPPAPLVTTNGVA